MKKNRKKTLISLMLACALLCALTPGLAEEAAAPSGVAWLFQNYYGFDVPEAMLQASAQDVAAVEVEGVTVQVKEALSDGEWLFTSALVSCDNPEVLIMPGSAETGEKVGGSEGMRISDDTRSYLTAAQEDGKRLLAVYVYPTAFDHSDDPYMMDHLLLGENRFSFLSGSTYPLRAEEEVAIGVQIYDVDVYSGLYTQVANETIPVTCAPIEMPTEKEWRLSFDAPLTGFRQVNTCLATYLHPIWRSEEEQYSCSYAILDVGGNEVSLANMPMWEAYELRPDDLFQVVLLPEVIEVK